MIDVHCHILPGIDDGPESMDVSVEMAETAIAEGITHIVATPHASEAYFFDFARVREVRDELQAKIGSRLALATGCDFHLNPENLAALRGNASPFCINQRDYLLVEFSEYSIPPAMDQTLHEIQLLGLRPVITHPERNAILRAQTDRLARWVRLGSFVQVTAGSLTGSFGAAVQKDAWRWMQEGMVHLVASDAHNMRGRPLRLAPAFAMVHEQMGEEVAKALFFENPKAALEGRDLPYVPELAGENELPRRKRFFFF